ncbi:hypothetical protein COLO4_34065 [Corchorus olitorius]|uniref:Uncharacterized protein n=1 Tax=Corchorus olitorius TaxID=93759 RepID=A0A1R3GNX8_9ROSI|nr:hypothetical protein COLO4_34065 [Corchorus olitorius]
MATCSGVVLVQCIEMDLATSATKKNAMILRLMFNAVYCLTP